MVGSIKFYDRKEIKDIIAYLKAILNPNDLINMRRIINLPTSKVITSHLSLFFPNIPLILLYKIIGNKIN